MSDYTSPFRTGIAFLDRLGVYEVLLPFLLIFTLVYAILEKSKVFGVEHVGEHTYSKKNLNAMFAFVTAFLVVASSRLVATINEAVANMTILMLLGVCFLLLLGVFHTGDKELELSQTYKTIFTVISFIGIIIIFLHALKTNDGTPWLYYGWNFLVTNLDTGAVGAVILTIAVVVLMGYITSDQKSKVEEKKD
ncbi:MAG: hypothetical protein QXE31_03620 [Candidatus Woesearchaeota archaeon]